MPNFAIYTYTKIRNKGKMQRPATNPEKKKLTHAKVRVCTTGEIKPVNIRFSFSPCMHKVAYANEKPEV